VVGAVLPTRASRSSDAAACCSVTEAFPMRKTSRSYRDHLDPDTPSPYWDWTIRPHSECALGALPPQAVRFAWCPSNSPRHGRRVRGDITCSMHALSGRADRSGARTPTARAGEQIVLCSRPSQQCPVPAGGTEITRRLMPASGQGPVRHRDLPGSMSARRGTLSTAGCPSPRIGAAGC
jgi:hypothetical protein